MIYSGHAQQVKIHHNLCYISDNNPTGNGGNAIGVVDEHYATSYNDAEDVDVYDNLIIERNKGFDLDLGSGQGPLTNVHIYHNMIINCGTGLYLYNYNPGTDWVTCEFKNNLVYGGTMIGTSGGTTGWSFDYNSWQSTPAAGSGGNDQIGNQNLSSPDTAVYGLNVTTANYKLTALSTGPIDNGATGLTLYDGDTMDLDFWGLERGASDIDIGGNEYDGAVPDPLPDPDPEPIELTIAQDAGRKELHIGSILPRCVDAKIAGVGLTGIVPTLI
ncbi:MAG: hypothetical protein M9918_13350 [Anaerolineae bacterium]|nr:hypothetical protein [Anaerolineae bacterium]